jgi:hypothetical protein
MLGVLLHAWVLGAADFEHHDLVCHLKTPQHCTSCALSPIGSEPRTAAAPGGCCLADAGRAQTHDVAAESALLSVPTSGRSPPRAA